MMQFLLFLMQGIPETAGVISFTLALARVSLRWKVILVFAFIETMIIYFLRGLPLTFGLHTIASIMIVVLFIICVTKVPPSTAFIAAFAASTSLMLLESTMYELFSFLMDMKINQIISDYNLWTLITLPQAFIMISLALIYAKIKKPQEGMWKI